MILPTAHLRNGLSTSKEAAPLQGRDIWRKITSSGAEISSAMCPGNCNAQCRVYANVPCSIVEMWLNWNQKINTTNTVIEVFSSFHSWIRWRTCSPLEIMAFSISFCPLSFIDLRCCHQISILLLFQHAAQMVELDKIGCKENWLCSDKRDATEPIRLPVNCKVKSFKELKAHNLCNLNF